MGSRGKILVASAVALAGLAIGLLVSRPWESSAEAQSIGPAESHSRPAKAPAPGRPVIRALPPSTFSADEVAAAVAGHNAWRKKYSVPALTWDADLAAYAQDWANQMAASGAFEHRPDDPSNPTGENIALGYDTIAAVVDAWGNEVRDYDLKTNTCADGKVCGHFTQVVWSTTTTVGCGKATGGGRVYWVCNYKPPGNYTGDNFRTGTQAG